MEPPIPSTTGAALLKCSLGRCWAWGGSVVPSWHRFWSPSSSEWWQETSDYLHSSKTPKRPTTPTPSPQWDVHSPQKKYVKHLTRLTKAQLHSTFDPGRPDIGWWPWPKHQGQASHFPNPEGAFFQKLWPWLIHFSLLIHVLISVVLQPPTKHRPNHQIFHWNFMHFAHTNKSPPLGAPDFCHCGLPVSKWLNTTSALPIQKKHTVVSNQSVVRLATWFWTIATYCCLQFFVHQIHDFKHQVHVRHVLRGNPLDHRGSQFSGPTNHSNESFPRVNLHKPMVIMSRSL